MQSILVHSFSAIYDIHLRCSILGVSKAKNLPFEDISEIKVVNWILPFLARDEILFTNATRHHLVVNRQIFIYG